MRLTDLGMSVPFSHRVLTRGGSDSAHLNDAIDLMLQDFGLEPERFRLEWVSASEAQRFAQVVTEMVEQVKKVGPSPYRVAV